MSESRFIIYALTDPDGAIRYVGKSTCGRRRPNSHRTPAVLAKNRGYSGAWIRRLIASGLTYGIVILEALADAESLSGAERRWIAYGRAQGWRLTNLTDGGEGTPGWVPSVETRAKIGAANRGPSTKKSVSAARRAARPEERARLRAMNVGRKHGPRSPETRAKISTALAGKPRHYMAALNKSRVWTEEQRAAIGASRARNTGNPPNAKRVEFNGETHSIAEWSRRAGVPYRRLRDRIEKLKWPIARALGAVLE